jgi:hypothetical protein
MLESDNPTKAGGRRIMLRPTLVTALVLASVAALLALATNAVGSPPQAFTGAGNVVNAEGVPKNDVVFDYTALLTSTGTFTGTYRGVGHANSHADGSTEDHFTYTATGSTPCETGTFVIKGNAFFPAGVAVETGHFTTVDDATNTAHIHIDSDFVHTGPGNPGDPLSFSGTYHCL